MKGFDTPSDAEFTRVLAADGAELEEIPPRKTWPAQCDSPKCAAP